MLWVASCFGLGYLFGNIPIVKQNFSAVALLIIFISVLPVVWEFIKARRPKVSSRFSDPPERPSEDRDPTAQCSSKATTGLSAPAAASTSTRGGRPIARSSRMRTAITRGRAARRYLCAEPCAAAPRSAGSDPTPRSRRCRTASRSRSATSASASIPPATSSARRRSGSRAQRASGSSAGDYKRAADPTCAPFELVPCDTFVTESTFGLPIYRWDPPSRVIAEILEWWDGNRERGRTSVLFCYTIGKAQRLLAELARVTDRPVFVHGMMLR